MVCSRAPAGGLVAGTSTSTHAPAPYPPVLGYAQLSILLGRTVGTLQADRCRKPESLPPACTPPGTRQPLWLLSDVLAWLAEHREAPPRRRPGRPEKTRHLRAAQQEVRHG